jgi:hypothetical protein
LVSVSVPALVPVSVPSPVSVSVPVPVSVPAPVPVSVPAPVPVPIPDPDLFGTVIQQQKICSESGLFNARRSFVSQKAFFDICFKFYVGPGPNPAPDPDHSVPVLATVSQHCCRDPKIS